MSKIKSDKKETNDNELKFIPVIKPKPKFKPMLPKFTKIMKDNIVNQIKKLNVFELEPYIHKITTNNIEFEKYLNKNIIPMLKQNDEEFCWSLDWDSEFFGLLIYNGFLNIAVELSNLYVLMPKLHKQRCIVDLSDINVIRKCVNNVNSSKSIKKKCKKYRLTVNKCFTKVIQCCLDQHGMEWLYPPMQGVLYLLNINNDIKQFYGVRVISIELWDKNNQLIAGEIGSLVGGIYTSLTGFYTKSGSGMVQLYGLQMLLIYKGFKMWDLGMHIKYKDTFLSSNIDRHIFVKKYQMYRNIKGNNLMSFNNEDTIKNVFDLISLNVSQYLNANNNSNDNEMKNNDEIKSDDNNGNKMISKKHQKRLNKKMKRMEAKKKKVAMKT